MCWEISLALAPPLVCTPSDAERSIQCQGDESLATELIISITHGHMALSCLLARQYDCQEHYRFSSGRTCRWGERVRRGGHSNEER